jgi:hypothetical protein
MSPEPRQILVFDQRLLLKQSLFADKRMSQQGRVKRNARQLFQISFRRIRPDYNVVVLHNNSKKKYAKGSGTKMLVPGEAANCGRNHKPLRIYLLLLVARF